MRRALALDARHFYAAYDLGRLLVRVRRYDEALRRSRGAARGRARRPGRALPDVHRLLAHGRKSEAERELALFKSLDEERKARRASGGEEQIEDTLPTPPEGEPCKSVPTSVSERVSMLRDANLSRSLRPARSRPRYCLVPLEFRRPCSSIDSAGEAALGAAEEAG